jgi:hypothetical protein
MSAESDLEEFLQQADRFIAENDLGLNIDVNPEVIKDTTKLLSLTPTEMYELSLDDINKAAIMIGQYCIYLQQLRNKLENTISWCTFYINSQVAQEWKNELYNFIPKEMKSHSIAETNSFLQKLMEMRLVAESRLRGIPEKMDSLRNIAFRLGKIQ